MFRATWKLRALSLGMVGYMAGSANAGEVGEAGADIAGSFTNVVKTVQDAFKGGEVGAAAQNELVEMAGTVCFVMGLLVVSYIVASAIGKFVGNMVTNKVDVTLGKFLCKAIRNAIMLVVLMIALDVFCGVNVAGFAAILAALGFAVGMALQGTLSNFAAGIMLLVFRPFKVGDYITVAGTEGTVEEIDLFTTRLNALDNRHLIVPNGEIFGAKLENFSRNPLRRVDVNVGAAYSADLETTRSALQRAVDQVAVAFPAENAEAPYVYLMELGASSVDWQLRVWCHPKNYWAVREELTAAAKNELDAANIGIPYPQLDVHVGGKLLAKAA